MCLERQGQRSRRESTRIPVHGGSPPQDKELRRQAHAIYCERMGDIARMERLVQREVAVPPKLKPPVRSPDGWCYIYFLQQGELVKIGRAADVKNRIRRLQTGNGGQFHLLAAIPGHAVIEEAIQARFAYLREQGEWFQIDTALTAFIEQARAGTNPIALLFDVNGTRTVSREDS